MSSRASSVSVRNPIFASSAQMKTHRFRYHPHTGFPDPVAEADDSVGSFVQQRTPSRSKRRGAPSTPTLSKSSTVTGPPTLAISPPSSALRPSSSKDGGAEERLAVYLISQGYPREDEVEGLAKDVGWEWGRVKEWFGRRREESGEVSVKPLI